MFQIFNLLLFYLKTRNKYGRPRNILYCLGGLGDDLCFTTVLKAYYLKYGEKPNIFSSRPILFKGNPYIHKILDPKDFDKWSYLLTVFNKVTNKTLKITHLTYYHLPITKFPDRNAHPHLIEMMAANVNITTDELLTFTHNKLSPIIYSVTEGCNTKILPQERYILIHSSSLSAPFPVKLKEWSMLNSDNRFTKFCERYGKLVNAEFGQLVQIGSIEDPLLPNVIDLRGKTDIPTLAMLCKKAACFIGLEGGIMHFARAYNTPSIIIYGGRTMPQETGYIASNIINLYSPVMCSPCWGTNDCNFEHECMRQITEESLYESLSTLLGSIKV